MDLHPAVAHGLLALSGQRGAVQPPLGPDHGLNDIPRSRALGNLHGVVLFLDEQTELLEFLLHLSTSSKSVHAGKLGALGVDRAVVGQDVEHRQPVALADGKIVRVVRRRDLDAPGAELLVHICVGDDHELARRKEGMHQLLADQVRVSRVLGVHSDGHVAQHRLETSSGDSQKFVTVFYEIFKCHNHAHLHLVGSAGNGKECALGDLVVVHLQVRQRRAKVRGPVHETDVPEHFSLFVESTERLSHGHAQVRVHREELARPVQGGGHSRGLLADVGTLLFLPLPHAAQKGVTAHVVSRFTLVLVQQLLDHRLGRNACVVSARQPQGVLAAHAVPASHAVLNRHGQRMTDVEVTRHVGRWETHHKLLVRLGVGRGSGVGREIPLRYPPLVPVLLDFNWIVSRRHGLVHRLLRHRFSANRRLHVRMLL